MHRIRYTLSLILGTILISPTTAPPVVAQEQDAGHCPGRLEGRNVSYRQQLREIEPLPSRDRISDRSPKWS